MEILVELADVYNRIRLLYLKCNDETLKKQYVTLLRKMEREQETLVSRFNIERKFLEMMKRESSTRLIRIQAQLSELRDKWRRRLDDKYKEESILVGWIYMEFQDFCAKRVRHLNDGYPEVANKIVTSDEFYKCYRRWANYYGRKKVPQVELDVLCEIRYGDGNARRIWRNMAVFLEPEDVDDFDRRHDANTSSTTTNESETVTS